MQLVLKNVCYRTDKSGFVLDNISFDIQEGFITGLIGVNGAGKTTIFNILMGVKDYCEGEILLNGNDIKTAYTDRMKIGFISEDQNFIEERTFLENARLRGIFYDDFSEDEFKLKMKEMNLPFAKQFGSSSRGEKIKFQLAFALSCKVEILLIDEATAGMDTVFRREFFKLLHGFMENDKHSVLISTHNEEEVKRHMDYVVYLENGKSRYACLIEDNISGEKISGSISKESAKERVYEKSILERMSKENPYKNGMDKFNQSAKVINREMYHNKADRQRGKAGNSQEDKLKAFDEQIHKMYSGNLMIQKMLYIFMLIFGMFTFLFCIEFPDTFGVIFFSIPLLFMGISFYMSAYTKIKLLNIYDIIKWLPTDENGFIHSRVRLLNKMVAKLGIIAVILSHIVPFCERSWNIYCILIPAIEMLFLWGIFYMGIKYYQISGAQKNK